MGGQSCANVDMKVSSCRVNVVIWLELCHWQNQLSCLFLIVKYPFYTEATASVPTRFQVNNILCSVHSQEHTGMNRKKRVNPTGLFTVWRQVLSSCPVLDTVNMELVSVRCSWMLSSGEARCIGRRTILPPFTSGDRSTPSAMTCLRSPI